MVIPKNRNSIFTNLSLPRLEAFISAIESKRAIHIPGSTSLCGESAACEFDFDGARYSVGEYIDVITSVHLQSAQPALVLTLIEEHEDSLAVVVNERNYDEAKKINEKINSMKKLLIA